MTLISLLLCVCMLMPMASAFTWQTPAEGNYNTGNKYRVNFSSIPAFPATNGVKVADMGSYTRFTATGNDPWVHLPVPTCASNQMKYLVVVYKTPVTGYRAKISFYTAYSGVGLSENPNSMVKRAYEAVDKWDAMILDMSDTAGSHKYTTLRMDMLDLSASGQYVDIKTVIGFPTYEQAVAYEANQDNWDLLSDNYTLDFGDSVALTNVHTLSYATVNGKFTRFNATGADPYMYLPKPSGKATGMDYAVILYRTKVSGAEGAFYAQYKNASGTMVNMGDAKSCVAWKYGNTTGQWATQIVKLTSISGNAGSNALTNFRLDPLNSTGVIDIASITCFSSNAAATAFAKSLEGFDTLEPNYAVDLSDEYTGLRKEKHMTYTFAGGQYLRVNSITADPNVMLPAPRCNARDMRYMVVVYRTNVASMGEIFVNRSDGATMSPSTRVQWTWGNTTGAWATQIIDLNSIAKSGTTYTGFRIDPLTVAGGTIDLRYVAGFATREDASAFAARFKGYTTPDPSYEADLSAKLSFGKTNQVTITPVNDKFTRFTATGTNPYLELPTPTARTTHMKYAVLVYRTNAAGSSGAMYAKRTDGVTSWGDAKASWKWKDTSGNWDSMVVDVSSVMGTGANVTLTSLRIDPLATATAGQWADLRSVALFETKAAADAYAASMDNLRTTVPNYVVVGGDKSCVSQLTNKNEMSYSVKSSSYLRITTTGEDSYVHLPQPNMAGKNFNYLTIFYRLTSGGNGQIVTTYDSTDHSVDFDWPATSGSKWGKVVVDISSISGGDKHPTVLRLDPLTEAGTIDIRLIAGFTTYEDAAAFQVSDYIWSNTAYEDKASVALDTDEGTLKYVYNSDDTVTISYSVNGNEYSYTVPNDHNYLSGAYAGTDDLGRELPSALDVGVYGDNGEHYVGLFYFLWMGLHGDPGVYDLQEILDKYGQEGAKDLSHYAGVGSMHWFSEPLYGYYYSNDIWVMRKHMEQLSNANIDFLYIDLTNLINSNYLSNLKQLMSVSEELRKQGFDAPQIVAYTNSGAANVVKSLYNNVYKVNWCPDSWFRINGKPVIVAPYSANIDNFFTIKQNQWPNDPNYKTDGWPWMDFEWPQRIFTATTSVTGDASAINVSIAQHSGNTIFSSSSVYNYSAANGNRGRSFDGTMTPAQTVAAFNNNPELTKYGLNFQAQWDRAIAANVPYVLVTGWNEWVAQRQNNLQGFPVSFVDTASEEYSRDAEMLRGGYFDNYYMQLIANVTKLKGAAPVVVQDARNPINVTGDFAQWDKVIVDYNDPKNDMLNRHGRAFGNTYQDDTTGRNDIVAAKVTADTEYIYFYVETANNISMYNTDASWMQLFVNTDRNAVNGWYGYDYIINYNAKDQNTTTVAKCTSVDDSFGFTEIGEVSYQVKGKKMMIAVPQSMLGIDGYKEIYVEFKWADADVQIDEMEDFYCYGDAAPAGRLNNVYQNYIPGVSQVSYDTYSADDTALESAIAEAKKANAKLYTADTYAAYMAAATAGGYYVNNKNATQAEVDAATKAIKTAKDALGVIVLADKTALQAAVNDFSSVKASDYSSASYKAYSAAVTAGKTVLNDITATQAAVDSATAAIKTAKSKLTVDKTALEAAITAFDSVDAADYTPASYKAYSAAVAAGQTVLDNSAAVQSEIDSATKAIQNAKASLTADKSALQAAVDQSSTVSAGDYTATSYKAYADAVAAGQTVLDNAKTTQPAVDKATAAINTAYAALVKVDKTALKAAVNAASGVTAGTYSNATYTAYKNAVAAGQTVLNNADAIQSEVDAATKAIQTAKSALATDKTALQAAVNKFSTVSSDDYTAASYKAYSDAVAAGKTVLNNAKATQTAIDKATSAINTAYGNLTDVDKSALEAAIKAFSSVSSADYTAASYKAYSDAVAAGKTVLNDTKATQTAVDNATAAIKSAKAKLVEKPAEPVSLFDYKAVGNVVRPGKDMQSGTVTLENGYVHVVPGGNDPFWFPFSGVTGSRYVAICYRTSDAVGANMQFFMGSTGTGPVDDSSMLQQPVVADGEWHVAIYDTKSLIDAGIYDGKTVSYFRFDPLECGYKLDANGQPYKDANDRWVKYSLPAGCSIDIAYIAFFDSAEEAERYDEATTPTLPVNYEVPMSQWTVTGHSPRICDSSNPMVEASGLKKAALVHQGAIGVGTIDLSKYSKVIITYGCDASATTQNLYNKNANNRIILSKVDTNGTMSPASGNIIASKTYTLKGWTPTVIEIDLSKVDYKGPVYITYDTLPGTFMLIGSIEFIG